MRRCRSARWRRYGWPDLRRAVIVSDAVPRRPADPAALDRRIIGGQRDAAVIAVADIAVGDVQLRPPIRGHARAPDRSHQGSSIFTSDPASTATPFMNGPITAHWRMVPPALSNVTRDSGVIPPSAPPVGGPRNLIPRSTTPFVFFTVTVGVLCPIASAMAIFARSCLSLVASSAAKNSSFCFCVSGTCLSVRAWSCPIPRPAT